MANLEEQNFTAEVLFVLFYYQLTLPNGTWERDKTSIINE